MKTFRPIAYLIALSFALGFSAHAAETQKRPKKRAAKPAVVQKETPQNPAELLKYADQPGQELYQVLLAEIALQRGDPEFASQAYAQLAKRTRDPKVLERTVEVASYARNFDQALDATRVWREEDPSSKRAQQLAVSMMLLSKQLDDLPPLLIQMLGLEPESLADNLLGLNRLLAPIADHPAVLLLLDEVCASFLTYPEAHYTLAVAAHSAGNDERARAEIRQAQALRPDWEPAVLFEAQLLSTKAPAEAIRVLQTLVDKNAQAWDARLYLARLLISEKRYTDAKGHFDLLLQTFPDRPEVIYPAALLALQQQDNPRGESLLKHFVTLAIPNKNPAYYNLGQIAEEQQQTEQAITYYEQIGAGELYLPAQFRQASLLAAQGDLAKARAQLTALKANSPDERAQIKMAEASLLRQANRPQDALDLLEEELKTQPDQVNLLYESALLAEKVGKLDVLETKLRRLIVLEPENAHAYNALGYSFADHNLQLLEAYELIEKALQLAPDDPAILDSMGWVHYRQGNFPEAINYLERAHALRADPEVAAHLGEALWKAGRQSDAQRVLLDAQKKSPDNEVIKDALRKFVQ